MLLGRLASDVGYKMDAKRCSGSIVRFPMLLGKGNPLGDLIKACRPDLACLAEKDILDDTISRLRGYLHITLEQWIKSDAEEDGWRIRPQVGLHVRLPDTDDVKPRKTETDNKA
jgi:hypothetical protein